MENIELTPNRMACNAITDENKNILITAFKSSPKSPAAIGKIEKKKLFKKKAKKVLRQRNRLGSESSQLSNASPLRSQQQVGSPYNLIEYCGDRSLSESTKENVAPYNLSAATDSASAITPGSDNFNSNLQVLTARDSEFSTAGVSVRPTPQKVIFVIPEGWASSIEIMRLPLAASLNSLDSSSPSSASTYGQYADSVGPMRSRGKIRSSRNTPYYSSRRDRHSYYARNIDSELVRTAARNNSKNQDVPENFEFARYNTALNGYQYESRDYEQTSSSVGPIRRNHKNKAFYTPYGNTASEMDYNSMDSASTSTISDGYNQADGRPDYSVRRNYRYSNKLNNALCWYCRKRGHLKVNCPLRMAHKNAEMTAASEGMQ